MSYLRRLRDYPKLAAWYDRNRQLDSREMIGSSAFIWSLCQALSEEDDRAAGIFARAFKDFLDQATDDDQIRILEDDLRVCEIDFFELISELCEIALRVGKGELYFTLLCRAAEFSANPTFRFLSAWVALNLNRFEDCIDQCEQIEQPFAAIYTLQGQAYLESSNPQAAIDSLTIATQLNPKEVLAWFQLAKAYHVTSSFQLAWQAVNESRKLAPQSIEVACMAGIIALEMGEERPLNEAWQQLSSHLSGERGNSELVTWLIEVALRCQNEQRLQWILKNADWRLLKGDPHFMRHVPAILRRLTPDRYQDLCREFLDRLVTQAG